MIACSDALLKDKHQVRIDLTDIKSFDHELGFLLGNDPTQYLPLVRHHTSTSHLCQKNARSRRKEADKATLVQFIHLNSFDSKRPSASEA